MHWIAPPEKDALADGLESASGIGQVNSGPDDQDDPNNFFA
jgi:hypothetical protein